MTDYLRHRDHRYGTPHDLRRGAFVLRRALLIGSCLMGALPLHVAALEDGGCPVDFFNVNHGCLLPEVPPEPLSSYDFIVVQIPLRILFPEQEWMRLEADDEAGAEGLFAQACRVLELSLGNALGWTRQGGLPTFIANFLCPQQNPHGRFAPRYSLTNPVYFVEQLNRALYELAKGHPDAFVVDLDQVSATFGRKALQDDSVTLFSHGAAIANYAGEASFPRLEEGPSLVEQYEGRLDVLLSAFWEETVAMFRSLRQVDAVKAVIVDLDDTLWRGVAAEAEELGHFNVEGWPIGLAEALLYVKKRGILLGVVSKNDRGRIEEIWPRLFGGRLRLEDFASVHIGWGPKAEGVARVLEDLGVLPGSVVFVDDNPVERSAVQGAFPEIRVLGSSPYHLRRIMLWSPEMQLAVATAESRRRTEMVRSQVVRETVRKSMGQEEFLLSVAPRLSVFEVAADGGKRFARALELLNKTNQFNTTGRRWQAHELEAFLARGNRLHAFEVADRFTAYGLVGVIVVEGSSIVQFVMSCRVLGLGVEIAALDVLAGRAIAMPVRGVLVPTAANLPVRDFWTRAGFVAEGGHFVLVERGALVRPPHVEVEGEVLRVEAAVGAA